MSEVGRVPLGELEEWWRRRHSERAAEIMASIELATEHWDETLRGVMLCKVREILEASLESTSRAVATLAARGMRGDDEPVH